MDRFASVSLILYPNDHTHYVPLKGNVAKGMFSCKLAPQPISPVMIKKVFKAIIFASSSVKALYTCYS